MTSFIPGLTKIRSTLRLSTAHKLILAACTANIEGDAGRRISGAAGTGLSVAGSSVVTNNATDPDRVTVHA